MGSRVPTRSRAPISAALALCVAGLAGASLSSAAADPAAGAGLARAGRGAAVTSTGPGVAPDVSGPGGREQAATLGEAVARFDAEDLEGRRWSLDDFRGRVVLIDFWATWCAPCLAEIPWLKRARERWEPDEFQIVGVNLDVTDRRTLVSWMNRQGIDWPVIWDGRGYNGELARLFGVEQLPVSLLLGPDGSVRALNPRGEKLLAVVEVLVGGVGE